MNRTRIALATLAVGAIAAVPAFAATTQADETTPATPSTITVNGNGVVQSAPDTADWSFGVQSQADSATKALAAVSAAMRKMSAAVRATGVAAEDIRTETVWLAPATDEQGMPTDRFTASSSVHVTVRKLSLAGPVVDAAVDAGATNVSGPSFSESDRERLYRRALAAAYDQARANAEAMAAKAGVTLGRAVAIQEGGGVMPVAMKDGAERAMSPSVAIEPGQSSTYAAVTVTFATS